MMQDVAEHLLCEFHHAGSRTVMRVVCECVDEFPEDGAWFIEQASRARLGQLDRVATTSGGHSSDRLDGPARRPGDSGTAGTSWIDP